MVEDALQRHDRIVVDGQTYVVEAVVSEDGGRHELMVEDPAGGYVKLTVTPGTFERVPRDDGRGETIRALTAVWGRWMTWAVPRIRAAVTATKPLRPFPHQDEAVFDRMLPQPRMRFLLADEPGTGKTIMSGMYLAEGRRRASVPGNVLVVCPAHLSSKWIRDLHRYFGVDAMQVTAEIGREVQDLRPDVDVWVVSVDLYTHNPDVRRKLAGEHASWSLVVFDEAHRLTPTSQYLGAGHQLAACTHHLLLLTATPHRGKEHYFRALLNLLDDELYPWDEDDKDYESTLRPGQLHFLRRMKEGLVNEDGDPLFPPRNAETIPVGLSGLELDAYRDVMSYVDEWYPDRSTLALSIYGKRAASSLNAVRHTLLRRRAALSASQAAQPDPTVPRGFDEDGFGDGSIDDDEAWERAEDAVVQVRSRNRREELARAEELIGELERVIDAVGRPSKWERLEREVLQRHDIVPGTDSQVLVFTEFTDTARWLAGLFADAGYSVEVLEGSTSLDERDELQQRFLDRRFQVLVSTDAGGEGIDLQSAHVMVNWDIPWSLVRLEQRMGRLHRVGQDREVFIYHLVSPETREGRVQEVMLNNLEEAGQALRGRIFDLLDATAERLDFNFAKAMSAAQQATDADVPVPDVEDLKSTADELIREQDRLGTDTDVQAAQHRFVQDRLEAINPVIVEGFIRQLAAAEGWDVRGGRAPRILRLSAPTQLHEAFGDARSAEVASDGDAVQEAKAAGADVSDVHVLGPTEDVFRELVDHATTRYEPDLLRGTIAEDPASLSDYVLFVYDATLQFHDGTRRVSRKYPFAVRYSGDAAFPAAWEAVMNLRPGGAAGTPSPAARHDADEVARRQVEEETERVGNAQQRWIEQERAALDEFEARYGQQLRTYDGEQRAELRERFKRQRQQREELLGRMETVEASEPTLVGWIQVRGVGRPDDLEDPDSEKIAVARVWEELQRQGYEVDDRQTAGVGYDLYARHRRRPEQRLVEVKGLAGDLRPIRMEQNEWAQALQRGDDYWLYVVVDCRTTPRVFARVADPAGALSGPRLIERFEIPVGDLRRLAEGR